MTVTIKTDGSSKTGHRLVWIRKIDGADSWPQVLVLYEDGNIRLKPHPPAEQADTCFGSSVVMGPAPVAQRPFVDIYAVNVDPSNDTLNIAYANGNTAQAHLSVDRTAATVDVTFDYGITHPVATFRSMYVADDNSDVDRIRVNGQVFEYLKGSSDNWTVAWETLPGPSWFFYRANKSRHNISSPDIRIELDSVDVGMKPNQDAE